MARGQRKEQTTESEVDAVVGQRKRGRTIEYLVRWKGDEEETWETTKNLKSYQSLIDQYLEQEEEKESQTETTSTKRGRKKAATSSRSRSNSKGRTSKSPARSRSRSRGRATATKKKAKAKPTKPAPVSEPELSSPEPSPVLPRRTRAQDRGDTADELSKKEEKVTETKTSIVTDGNNVVRETTTTTTTLITKSSDTPAAKVCRFKKFACRDLPIIIVVISLLVLFATMVVARYKPELFSQ